MSKRFFEVAGIMGLLAIILLASLQLGCSRSEPPQSQQTAVPMTAAPVAQAPAPQQPYPPPAYAPSSPAPTASPQYATPPQQVATQAPPAGPQNFSQIQLGMTSMQIRQLVGEPSMVKQKGPKVEYEYLTPQGKFEVNLLNDRVVSIETH